MTNSPTSQISLDFIIGGAEKCATTWLCHVLNSHHDISIPLEEPHYFSRYYLDSNTLPESYVRLFSSKTRITGENSNSYMTHRQAPQRIARFFPDVKFVFSLRNPVDRAYSDYCMQYRRGPHRSGITGDISFVLDPDRAVRRDIIDKGFYLEQINRFLRLFPQRQIHIVLYDDIQSAPQKVLTDLLRFLNVDDTPIGDALGKRVNEKPHGVFSPKVKHWLRKSVGERVVQNVGRSRLWARVRPMLISQVRYPQMTGNLRMKLTSYYEESICELGHFLNRDLGSWLRI